MISHIPIVVQYYFKSDNGLELHTKYINTNYPDTLGSVFYPTDSFSIDWQTGSMGKFHPIRKIIDGKLTYGWISNDLVCFFTKINMVSVDEFLESDILYLQPLKKVVFPSIFEEIRVINLIGQTQIQQKIIGLNEFSLNLESGIYVLELTKNKKMVRKKIYIE